MEKNGYRESKKFIQHSNSQVSYLSLYFFRVKKKIIMVSNEEKYENILEGGDSISLGALSDGIHEPDTTSLIKSFADGGYDNFLIDIGANIGLISCQTANNFSEVHMYEPNPLCCHVLAVNSKISISNSVSKIYNFGLGDGEKKLP